MKWIKDNWLLVALGLLVAFLAWRQFSSSTLYEKLMDQYEAQADAHAKTVADLEKENARFVQKQEEINKKHTEEIQRIESDYHKSLAVLQRQRAQTRSQLGEEAKKNPTVLTDKITEFFNIPVYSEEVP